MPESPLALPRALAVLQRARCSRRGRGLRAGGCRRPRGGGPTPTEHEQLEEALRQASGSSACSARALPLRRHQLPGHRRHARRVAGQGEDRHPSGPRGPEKTADLTMHPVDPERFADVVGARLRQLPMPRAPHTLLPRVMAAAQRVGAAAVVRARLVHLAARVAGRIDCRMLLRARRRGRDAAAECRQARRPVWRQPTPPAWETRRSASPNT